MTRILEKLITGYEDALRAYLSNGRTDYDAGILEGIKRALEIIQAEATR